MTLQYYVTSYVVITHRKVNYINTHTNKPINNYYWGCLYLSFEHRTYYLYLHFMHY